MARLALFALAWGVVIGAIGALPTPAAYATPPPAAPAAIPPDMMGMVIRDPWFDFNTNPAFPNQSNQTFQDRMGAILAQLGVRWVRLDFRIAAPLDITTGASDPAEVQKEISKNDYFINVVAPRHGLKVLGLLSFDLIQGTDAHLLNTGPFTVTSIYGGGVNAYMDEWLDRALLVADRYGDKVAAYQILNEQNRLPQYIPNGPIGDAIAPDIMARLVTKFYRYCRGIEPLPRSSPPYGCQNASVILGGLHPRGTSDWPKNTIKMTDAQYLQAMYASAPFQEFRNNPQHNRWPVDGIGYHPYPEEIRLSIQDVLVDTGLNRMRAVLVAAGDPYVPFWISEVGYNVGFDVDGPLGKIPAQTEAGQAAFMYDVYLSLAARSDIAHIFWFKYEDFPPASGANAQRWGVVRIPFTESNSCPGGACYAVNGEPQQWRAAYMVYSELAGMPVRRISLPVIMR